MNEYLKNILIIINNIFKHIPVVRINNKIYNNKYKLVRESTTSSIIKSPEIIRKDNINLSESIKHNNVLIVKLLRDFVNELFKLLPKKDIIIFLNNISSLNIKEGNSREVIRQNIVNNKNNQGINLGYYACGNNIIRIISNEEYNLYNNMFKINNEEIIPYEEFIKYVLSHELLHASSSIEQDNIAFSGFSQTNYNSNFTIGDGLNEGYTEYILEKLYPEYKALEGRPYTYERKIASLLELVVGKNNMLDCYFNADLSTLLEILNKYNDVNINYEFIVNLDKIFNIDKLKIDDNSKKNLFEEYNNKILNYLINTFINKYKLNSLEDSDVIEIQNFYNRVCSIFGNKNNRIVSHDLNYYLSRNKKRL